MFIKYIRNYFDNFRHTNKEKGVAFIPILIGLTVLSGVGWAAYNYGADVSKWTTKEVLGVLYYVAVMLFGMSSNLFAMVTESGFLSQPITSNASVVEGWAIVRDFANMFVVLGFVVVGIATILRIREYEAQKTLVPLIIVAILINFSLLFCGIIIDGTNVTMNYFLNPSSGPGVGATAITQPFTDALLSPTAIQEAEKLYSADKFEQFVIMKSGISLCVAISAMVFFIYAILFLFRYVALMCLVILAPLGFVCYVFPATKSVFKKWWEQFLQWSIIGIPSGFFIYLAGHLLQTMGLASSQTISGTSQGLAYWVPVAFLFFSYSLIFQTSAIGASAATGLATGALGYAWGATKWAGRKGAGAAWNSRAGQATRRGATMAGEKLGLVAPGTTNLMRQKQQQEHDSEKRAATWTEDQRKNIAIGKIGGVAGVAVTKRHRNDRLEAIEQMAQRGELGKLSSAELDSAMKFYAGSKKDIGALAKKDFRAAAYDTKRVDKYIEDFSPRDVNGNIQTMNRNDAMRKVREQQLNANWKDMDAKQKAKVETAYLTDDFVKDMNASDIGAFRSLAPNHATRTHLRGKVAMVDTEIADADARNDVTELRRLRTLKKKLETL